MDSTRAERIAFAEPQSSVTRFAKRRRLRQHGLKHRLLAHVPWVRAVSIVGQEGIKLQLATPWNQLPKGTKVTVKMPRKKFGTFLLDVLRLRAPWAKVGDAVTLVTPRDKLEEFLNLLPESVTLISCPEESAQSKRRKLI